MLAINKIREVETAHFFHGKAFSSLSPRVARGGLVSECDAVDVMMLEPMISLFELVGMSVRAGISLWSWMDRKC